MIRNLSVDPAILKLSPGSVILFMKELINSKRSKMQEIYFPAPVEEKINKYVERIVRRLGPEKIIVFGSCASGDQTVNSDLDLLVITEIPTGETKSSLRTKIRGWLEDRNFPIDLIIHTPEQFQEQKNSPGMIAETASREGKVYYEQSQAA
jgi:predicted nucleotidyltransferase